MSDDKVRVATVRELYARRTGQPALLDRVYVVYCAILLVLLYAVPFLYQAGQLDPVVTTASWASYPGLFLIPVALCWAALFLGQVWGPLLTRPFLVHVYASTDIWPRNYLRPLALKRLSLGFVVSVAVFWAILYAMTDVFSHGPMIAPALVMSATGALGLVACWLWGQVMPPRQSLHLGASILLAAVGAAAMLLANSAAPLAAARLINIGALTIGVWIAGTALKLLNAIDLTRLREDSSRTAVAQVFAQTGTLHHAVDLFRPVPNGFTKAMIVGTGRLRGFVFQGVIRMLRTPIQGGLGLALMGIGPVLIASGTLGQPDRLALASWLAGALALYYGFGLVAGSWQSLLGELTKPALYGPKGGGLYVRNLTWPLTTAGLALVVGAIAIAWTNPPIWGAYLALSFTVAMAFAARLLRELKTDLPVHLLYPITTPLGDISGVRILAWQFDGLLILTCGVILLAWVPSMAGASLITVGVVGWSIWRGIRLARLTSH